MRMMVRLTVPHEPFNSAVRDGTAAQKMKKILDEQKPEAAYFMDHNGRRSAVLIIDLPDASKIPSLAEPWFLTFNADVEVHPVMTPQDLAASGLDELGKKWR
ncbi:MAG TPA: DUF3303 family protein [Acidobacteriaceae bacterium]|nr:DUF3303 family protein [Acidobacteriaceae bacterium]